MNKHSAAKKRPAKPSRNRGARKPSQRKVSARPAAARKPAKAESARRKPVSAAQLSVSKLSASQITISRVSASQLNVSKAAVSPVAAIGSALRAHKFRVGQTVFYTSSPISRPGATGSYKVVRLLPSDGDDYQYRIKHAGEAFERVAKESQLELEA
jgi:hypothetical protein